MKLLKARSSGVYSTPIQLFCVILQIKLILY